MRRFLSAAVIAVFFSGCSTAYSSKPVGEAPAPIKSEEWEGTWINKEGAISIKVLDSEKGVLNVALVERMELVRYQVNLLSSGQWMFWNVPAEDRDDRFLWGRISKDGNQIIIWSPSVSRIAAHVKDGSLPGSVDDGGNVTIGNLAAEHYKVIKSTDQDVLFDWENPTVFLRLAN